MNYDDISWTEARYKMTDCALAALKARGYRVERIPERGRSSNWNYVFDGGKGKLCIRTTNDRWFAFMNEDTGWKTLDDMDKVVVVAVDNPDKPSKFETYLFSADEVKKRFDASRAARKSSGMTVKTDYGMWVGLDNHLGDRPLYVGSGLGEDYPAISVDPIFNDSPLLIEENESSLVADAEELGSIAEIMENAKLLISKKMQVPISKISLDLKFDF